MPNWSFIAVHGTYLLALAVWIGGTAFVTFVAAPVAFRLLSTRAEAGRVVGEMLRRFEKGVVGCLLVLALTAALKLARFESAVPPVIARYVLLALAAFAAVAGMTWIAPRLRALREVLGPIDSVPESDPRRVAFRRLHGVSMILALAQLLLASGALYLS
jgi:uncharacterized membrane protein